MLDEPTSQIDVETEALLNRALERLCASKTVLLIAHRLSTIEQADRILVMEGGRLVESGTRERAAGAGRHLCRHDPDQARDREHGASSPPRLRSRQAGQSS